MRTADTDTICFFFLCENVNIECKNSLISYIFLRLYTKQTKDIQINKLTQININASKLYHARLNKLMTLLL